MTRRLPTRHVVAIAELERDHGHARVLHGAQRDAIASELEGAVHWSDVLVEVSADPLSVAVVSQRGELVGIVSDAS